MLIKNKTKQSQQYKYGSQDHKEVFLEVGEVREKRVTEKRKAQKEGLAGRVMKVLSY